MAKKSKNVVFTLASLRDSQPTVTAARLGLAAGRKSLPKYIVLDLRSASSKSKTVTRSVTFRLNRIRKDGNGTYIALDWPKKFKLPSVGKPTEALVDDIRASYYI